ncbi:MAG: phosphoribosylformylglycinamidine cyclo-ligase [Phycisphaerae bacterium]
MAKRATYSQAGVDIEAGDRAVERLSARAAGYPGPRDVFGHFGRMASNDRLRRKAFRPQLPRAAAGRLHRRRRQQAAAGDRGRRPARRHPLDRHRPGGDERQRPAPAGPSRSSSSTTSRHRIDPEQVAEIVAGIADGCELAGCALIGGETAELPELYAPGHFDLAGFTVGGVVERRRLIDGKRIEPGDALVLGSVERRSSNGYALARHLAQKQRRLGLRDQPRGLDGSIGEVLLRPTRIYERSVRRVLANYRRKRVIKAMAHITGGGLPGNLPRVLPADCDIVLRKGSWPMLPVFEWIASMGVAEAEMYRVFNMGIGYVLVVAPSFARAISTTLRRAGEAVYTIGAIRRGTGRLRE